MNANLPETSARSAARVQALPAAGSAWVFMLGNEYPRLRSYLGEVRFKRLAEQVYAASQPDERGTASLSAALPLFLGRYPAFISHPEISELAHLENAINTALLCGAEVTNNARVFGAEINGVKSQYQFQQGAQVLRFLHSTTSIWSALQCGEPPPAPYALEQVQNVLVSRKGTVARFRILGEEENTALKAMLRYFPPETSAKLRHTPHGTRRALSHARPFLQGWRDSGLITSIVF